MALQDSVFPLNCRGLVTFCCFSDSGSHDEGIHIPKGRGMHNNLAKSLPVNVPAFLPQDKKLSDERNDERVSDFPGLKLILR